MPRRSPPFTAAGMMLTAAVYATFALVQVMRWSPWLLLAATIGGPLAMMTAGTPDPPVGLASARFSRLVADRRTTTL